MKIADILKKVTAGTELTDAEKAFLAGYKEPAPNTAREKELADQLKEAQEKLDAAEREKLTENERIQKDLEKAQKDLEKTRLELKAAQDAKAAQDHDIAVRKLAAEHKFNDPEYLKYLVGRDKIDLAKDGKTFLESLKKDSPKYFDAAVNSGGGGGPGDGNGDGKGGKEELATLLKKTDLTNSEAARVIELQAEIAKTEGSK